MSKKYIDDWIKEMTYTLPDLPYDFDALEPYIDKKTMEIHYGKHHAGYVEKLNNSLKELDDVEEVPIEEMLKVVEKFTEEVQVSIRNNGGGHANHSLFWKVMSPEKKELDETTKLSESINKEFGDLTNFKAKFSEVAMGRFGSGWAWLVVDDGILDILSTPNQDSPLMQHLTPILGLDVWEHAYYLKYQNKRADYVKAWWNILNWEEVNRLYNKAVVR